MPIKDRTKQNQYQRDWYIRNKAKRVEETRHRKIMLRQFIWEIKLGSRCERCSEDDPRCLDFHHKDPSEKELAIGKAVTQGWSKDRLVVELAKCEILCANCHRKEHTALMLVAA